MLDQILHPIFFDLKYLLILYLETWYLALHLFEFCQQVQRLAKKTGFWLR